MKFEDLEARLRRLETAHDRLVPADVRMVVRLDGRHFTRLTKEALTLEAPFDARFRDAMLDTVEHLMTCGVHVTYGYTESDEISLLLAPDETAFGRKVRKLISILAGEASARFSLRVGTLGVFDARVCELPTNEDVVDYFRWRQEDARRNALNGHCYWLLRGRGVAPRAAAAQLESVSVAEKQQLLAEGGVDFAAQPAWQRLGVGLSWQTYTKAAADPRTGAAVEAVRRRVQRDLELPEGTAYTDYLVRLLETELAAEAGPADQAVGP
jgi:tRNA(His) guanylyltransferase